MWNGRHLLFITACLLLGKSCSSSEIEEFEKINSENHPIRKEFNNHTETCFKQFKSSMVKLALLFLDPASETNDSQQESKCWVKCMLEQFQFIKANKEEDTGEIVPARIMEKTNELSQQTKTKLGQIVEKCENHARAIEGLCNKAFGFARCVFETYRKKEVVPIVPMIPISQPAVLVTG